MKLINEITEAFTRKKITKMYLCSVFKSFFFSNQQSKTRLIDNDNTGWKQLINSYNYSPFSLYFSPQLDLKARVKLKPIITKTINSRLKVTSSIPLTRGSLILKKKYIFHSQITMNSTAQRSFLWDTHVGSLTDGVDSW